MKLKTLALAMTATVASFSVAAETPYGDLITNTATLNYSVTGGASITATPATAVFNVDRLVKFNLTSNIPAGTETAEVGDNTTVGFTLTNNSNAPLDYSLPVINDVTYYFDTNGDGALSSAEEVPGNEITGVISLLQSDGSTTAYTVKYLAVYNPLEGIDGDTKEIIFTATAVENDSILGTVGSTIVPTPATTVWDKDNVQTVAETDADGNFITEQSETITFTFSGANIVLEKSVSIVSDPISRGESGTAPTGYIAKAIPGAFLKYTITVTNSGSKAAALTLGDTMPSIFSESDINSGSYKQSINGVPEVPLLGVTAATSSDIVTLSFPAVIATAKVGSDNGTVVTTFEVTLP
jgi:hypothetical protein